MERNFLGTRRRAEINTGRVELWVGSSRALILQPQRQHADQWRSALGPGGCAQIIIIIIIIIIYCYTTRVAYDTHMYIHKNIQLRNTEYKNTRIEQQNLKEVVDTDRHQISCQEVHHN